MISAQTVRNTGAPAVATARDLLRRQFWVAHDLLDATIDAFPNHLLRRRPRCGGDASPVARYARTILCEDMAVNGILATRRSLALSTWSGRTGLSELPPCAAWAGQGDASWTTWARDVRVDGPGVRAYARAVYASTDAYIAALPVDDFDPARRSSPACVLTALLLTVAMRRGELACLAAFTTTEGDGNDRRE